LELREKSLDIELKMPIENSLVDLSSEIVILAPQLFEALRRSRGNLSVN